MPGSHQRNPSKSPVLQGWADIARYLGQPVATVQRWSKSGMPVSRKGRYMTAEPEELDSWLGHESGAEKPVHIPANETDLTADLRLGLSEARRRRKIHRVK